RVRNHWHAPAHELAVADGGGSVVLVAHRGEVRELHRLDLVARRVRPWLSVRAARVLQSFDGGLLPIVDDYGLAFLDAAASTPRVLWREFDRDTHVIDIARSPGSMAALVQLPAHGGGAALELWRWDLPSLMLRERTPVVPGDADGHALSASGLLLTRHPDPDGASLRLGGELLRTAPPDTRLLASGEVMAVATPTGIQTVVDVGTEIGAPVARVAIPDAGDVGIRHHANIITVRDSRGRVVAVDLVARGVVADLRTTL
ncbi:MAG: hypothetical protein QOI35_3320, partial [Cryptosporangiaceae bacterium]|nr:hypothetical protein [Cryptosporangiaceae bacterium]